MSFTGKEIVGMIIMIAGVAAVWKTEMIIEKLPFKIEDDDTENGGNKMVARVKMVGFGLVTVGFLMFFI